MNAGAEDPNCRGIGILPMITGWKPVPRVRDGGDEKSVGGPDDV